MSGVPEPHLIVIIIPDYFHELNPFARVKYLSNQLKKVEKSHNMSRIKRLAQRRLVKKVRFVSINNHWASYVVEYIPKESSSDIDLELESELGLNREGSFSD
jgi:hypothetical protein